MKFIERQDDRLLFRLNRREHQVLSSLLGFRAHFPRRSRPLFGDARPITGHTDAQADLEFALDEHRKSLTATVDKLLTTAAPRPENADALDWTLNTSEAELILQALNDVRVGAWERLGCPDFESGQRPEMSADNAVCFWTLQLTDGFLALFLRGLDPGH